MDDLKLLALDSEDLEVVSAYAQDAVVRVPDMGFARADKRFAMLMNRFAWEEGVGQRKGLRKRAGLHFDRVTEVRSAGIDLSAQEGVLELLAITFEQDVEPSGTIVLNFAGGGTVRLTAECIEARLEDLGAAWAAKGTPIHAEGKA